MAPDAESVACWTWNVFIDQYAWTNGGEAMKAFRTREEALADAHREWGDDTEVTAIPLVLIDGLDGGGQ